MAVFRVERNTNYTTMSNYHLRDTNLSLKAKGLLSVFLSLPDEWHYSISGLMKITKEGRDCLTAVIKELEKAGYLVRYQSRDETGKIVGIEYVIYEKPQAEQAGCCGVRMNSIADSRPDAYSSAATGRNEEPMTGNPSAGKPSVENPSTDKPSTENPLTENPTEQNTNKQNTKRTKTPISPAVMKRFEDYAGDDQELLQRLADFAECRRKARRAISTDRQVTLLLNKLDELSGGKAAVKRSMLDEAVEKGWLSVYAPKADQQPRGQPQRRREEADPWR